MGVGVGVCVCVMADGGWRNGGMADGGEQRVRVLIVMMAFGVVP